MAIYHYHREIGKRKEGKNAVFAVAYIRGEERTCHKTQETKNFSHKPDVIYTNCILPDDVPTWATKLRNSQIKDESGHYVYDKTGFNFSDYAWNQLEFIEKRHDSQLYFHDDMAIPIELSQEAAIELVYDFVKEKLATNGIFCDVAIHWESTNPHAHVVMPLRQLTEEGFSKKLRFTKQELSQVVERVRAEWADYVNCKLKEHGIDARIDHRSHKDRGLELIPTVKVGKATHMTGTKHQEIRVAQNQLIRSQNFEKIQQNPDVLATKVAQDYGALTDEHVKDELIKYVVSEHVLKKIRRDDDASREKVINEIIGTLKKEYAVFSERELKQQVMEKTESLDDFNHIVQAIGNSEELINLGLGNDGRTHYVTQQAFALETELCQITEHLSQKNTFLVSDQVVNRVAQQFGLNEGQQVALKHITQGGNLALVVGVAGSGKTYMLKAAYEVWKQAGYRVHGVAFSGRASAGLENDSGIPSKTIDRFLKGVRSGYTKINDKTIVVMDEAGMTSLDDMHQVLNVVQAAGGKFSSVGDIEQTQPVGRGAPMRAMIEQAGCVVMDTIIRQKVAWQRDATLCMETQRTGEGLDAYQAHGQVNFLETQEAAIHYSVEQWYQQARQHERLDLSQHILIAHKNETVGVMNHHARQKLLVDGVIDSGVVFKAAQGEIAIAVGERLLFSGRNDYRLGLRNGDFGTVLKIEGDDLTVKLDSGIDISFSTKDYRDFSYGYAATIHKLQGFTGDYAFEYVDGRGWDRHLFLVGSSRHRYNLTIVADHEHFKDYADLKQVVSRHGLKDHIFDYPASFSIRRGFEPNTVAQRTVNFLRKTASKVQDSWLYLVNYQDYLEKQASKTRDPYDNSKQQRQDAVIVADFCDNRIQVAEKIASLEKVTDAQVKAKLQKEIYDLQLKNSVFARVIDQDYAKFNLAMDRNRIGHDAIKKAVRFGDRYDEIKKIVNQYHVDQFYNPILSDAIMDQFNHYYGHMVASFDDKDKLNQFITELKHQSHIRRYDTAFETFGIEFRPEIKNIKHYLDLDYEITQSLKLLNQTKTDEQPIIKQRLHDMSIKRDQLANTLIVQMNRYEALITHFGVVQERILQHQMRFKDRELVKLFSELKDSTTQEDNLYKQLLAHKIKQEPKRYGIFIDDFLKEGWRGINLENWRYERNQQLFKSSAEFKANYQLVRRYFDTAYAARNAWEAAIKRRNTGSPNYRKFVKRAQGLSSQRDKMASLLINDMERYAGVLAFEKVDLAKLSQRARYHDYFARYLVETNEIRRLRMAHHISKNMKDYGHAIAVHGLYQDIKERARHYDYLHLVKNAPNQAMCEAIRLAEQYYQKQIEAGQAWGQCKVLEKLKKENLKLLQEAKHLTYQRNKAAYDFIENCTKYGLIDPEIKGIKLNYAQLHKASQQHIAYQRVLNYLNAKTEERGYFANELLNDRSSYHFIYDKAIHFDELKSQAKNWRNGQAFIVHPSAPKHIEIKRWDFETISYALMANPEDTYVAILGEPKKRTSKEWRYEGGLVVTLKGSDAGKWYSFSQGKGGGPIKAIQDAMGLSFKDALEHGAKLAGLSDMQAMTTEMIEVRQNKTEEKTQTRAQQEALEREQRIQSAKSIWEGTQPIQDTLAERYFTEQRKITDLERMEIRYWPEESKWIDYDDQGKRFERINKIPAAVVAVKNHKGDITGVQRIYLDKKTADKNNFIDKAKLSKGVMQGAAAVIQSGVKGGCLYVVEGPETGASIALADKKATVLAALSVSNLANLGEVIHSYSPSEIIIAADNDGQFSETRKTTNEAFNTLKKALENTSTQIRLAFPNAILGMEKVDWNDVLIKQGQEALKTQLGISEKKITDRDLYYHVAQPISYTPAEHYLREVKGLVGVDLSEVRYHPAVHLPESDKTQHAIVLPAINRQGEICAEQILYLDSSEKRIVNSFVRGDKQSAAIAVQRGDELATVYIADNFIDAKSIAVGNTKANIFVSLDNYRDLNRIDWIIQQLPEKPSSIALITDNFDKQTEKTLFELTQPLRDKDYDTVMVKGRLSEDYTHVSINDALVRQDKIRGESFIQRMAIQMPAPEKISLKERLSRAVKNVKIEQKQIAIIRPEAIMQNSYYIALTKEKFEEIKTYFDALEQFNKKDDYQSALTIAKKANSVYDFLSEERRKINLHPQNPARVSATSEFELIRKRVEQEQPLGLHDLSALLKEIVSPKMDSKTREQLVALANIIATSDYNKNLEKAAMQFIKEKSDLIKAWRNEALPDSTRSFSLRNIETTIDRETLLNIVNYAEEISQKNVKDCGHKKSKSKDNDDRSRGGRSL